MFVSRAVGATAGRAPTEPLAMQLDLFAAGGTASAPLTQTETTRSVTDIATLSDAAILAAIPDAGVSVVLSLMYEAGRRRLHEAIPILGRLCRIFAGFGIEHEVPEQAVALDALASIGGHDAEWSYLDCWMI